MYPERLPFKEGWLGCSFPTTVQVSFRGTKRRLMHRSLSVRFCKIDFSNLSLSAVAKYKSSAHDAGDSVGADTLCELGSRPT